MMRLLTLILTILLVEAMAEKLLESEDIINYVNKLNTTWTAGYNFNLDTNLSNYKNLFDAKKLESGVIGFLQEEKHRPRREIPASFDARLNWRYCSSIGEIHDQGACGSCWAVAVADAFTDRTCIVNSGPWQRGKHLSAHNLLSCCYYCGNCNGGYIERAWLYLQQFGIVTGGYYQSREGCQPYVFQPCEHHVRGYLIDCDRLRPVQTPMCVKNCYSPQLDYNRDKIYAQKVYRLNSVTDMQEDIMTNGPITALLRVYEDFPSYKRGVYHYTAGNYLGALVVRIIGWGSYNGIPYWLVANSFNTDWGDRGYFKIVRGNNECGIEEYVFAGIPAGHIYNHY